MSDLNTEILISANAEGVEAGVGRAKKSLAGLGDTAQKIGKSGADGMQALGAGADMSARKVESATKNMVGSLQRQIAAMEAGDKSSRKYQETLAKMRGVDVAALKPYLDQLDSLQNKTTLAERAQASFNSVMLKGAAVFAAAGAIASYVKVINDGVDALNDLKDATGSSIENISALEDVGRRAGASFDVVSTSLIKFNNVLSDAKPGSAAEQAIKALGLSVEELKRLDPSEALRQASVALNKFADDGDKARLVQELFGKSVREVAPFLKDLAESGALVAKVTTEQAEQAEKFNKELSALGKNAQDASRALVGPMVSAINEVIAKFKEGREAGKSFLEIGWANYTSGVRELYGMAPPAQSRVSGGATGSWDAPPEVKPSVGPLPDTKKPKGASKAELSDYDKLIQKLGVELPKAAAEAEAAQMGYNKAQAEFLALAGSEVWAKFTNSQRANVAALFENKIASEQAGEAAKILAKANTDAAQAREKYLASLETGIGKIRDDIAAQQEATARMGLSKEAIADLDAAKLEMLATDLELQAIKAMDRNLDQQTYDSLKTQAALYRDLAVAKKGGAAKETALDLEKANEQAAKKAQEDWERAADDINRSLTDALMRGFESGKGFAETMRDTVVNMFKTMVLRPVISAVLSPISGGIQGMMGGLAGGAGGGSGGGGIINMAQQGYSLYNTGSQAWTLGSQYLGGTMSGANALGSMYANATGGGLDALLATNGAYGTAGGGAASGGGMGALGAGGIFAAVALAIGNALGVFRTDTLNGKGLSGTLGNGKDLQPWEEWREGGTLFDGPSFSTMNPVAELARAREQLASLQAANSAGTLGNPQQLATQQGIVDELEKQYGGLAEATAKQSKVIQAAFDAMRDSAGDMADTLGLSSDKVRSFTTLLGGEKGLNFDGLKPEEQQAKLAEALATANNELAQQILGTWETTTSQVSRIVSENIGSAGEDMQIVYSDLTETITNTRYIASEYAKDGEKAIDTLTRLATSLTTVNTIWDQLGNDMMEASLAGADAASRIAEAFGGLEAMSATTGSYFQNFYDSGEQREAARRQLEEQFGKLNLRLPDIDASNAREQYRQLAEAQDRNTEEGLKAYVALLQLSGAFANLTDSASLATETMEQQRQAAYSALERSISDSNRALQSQLDTARDVESTLGDLFDLLHDNVRELYGEVDSTRGMQATQGNAFITQALAAAQKSGYLPDADKLADAISAARGGIDGGAYTTQFGQDRDRLVLAGRLSGLEKITEKQLTDAQKTVRALEEQIDQGEQTLDFWRQQIEIASGTYEGILSVEAAVQNLQAILNPTTGKPGGANTLGGGSTPSSGTGAIPRAGYGAEEALGSFEKFKAWYTGLKSNADPSKLMGSGYEVPDWLKVSNFGADSYSEKDLFGSYLFFKNNPQYANDYQQIIDTGRSSYATDGSTLLRTDLTKLPADVAAYYKDNPDALKTAEGFGLDPTLALQIYQKGGGQFGINQYGTNFTEWLKDNMLGADGTVKPNNNVLSLAQTGYGNYNLARWQLSSGNIVDRDGTIYTPDGKRVGRASQSQYEEVYGAGAKPTGGNTGAGDDYLGAIKTNIDSAISAGWSAQQLADGLISTGTSLQDVATAYGISVEQVKENLIAGGATNIPKFAVGTNYVPRDMLAYIHEGEAVVPKAYNPAAGGESSGSSVRLELLVEQLLAQVANLESAANTTASNTQLMPQMARQFDSVTQGGTVLRNKAVA